MIANFDREILQSAGTHIVIYRWLPHAPIRARVLLTHGHGEYAVRFSHVAEVFAGQGIAFYAYDLRGHGESGGKQGDAAHYGEMLADMALVREHLGPAPMFHYGHSFGAQILLKAILERKVDPRGVVLSAPWLGLTFRVPFWKLPLARTAQFIWPGLRMRTGIERQLLSTDMEHLEASPRRDLAHRWMSVRLFHAGCHAARDVMRRAAEIQTPMLVLQGSEDALTSLERTRTFYDELGSKDKTLQVWEGMRHEPHNEKGREEVLALIVQWILERADGGLR